MDKFDHESLQELATDRQGPCVSLFLPTHPSGREGEQDAIRLKNLLRDAQRQLSGHWMDADDARQFVATATKLSEDTGFWAQRRQGLAVFAAAGYLRAYRVGTPFPERMTVSHRFRVRPMLPLLEHNRAIYLLALSENKVGCYRLDEQSIKQLDVPNLPINMEKTLNYAAAGRGSQVHTGTHEGAGKQAAVFHGQGGKPDAQQNDKLAYCAAINEALTEWLGDSTTPLLLACVDSLATLYRQKNTYKYLMPDVFAGNHDYQSEHDLRLGAWKVAEPLLHADAATVAARYADRKGTDKTIDEPKAVVMAALQGRVESMLYNPKAELFGECISADDVSITGKADDDDLIDVAAVETIRHGGTIHAMADRDVPTNAPLAAILRY